MMYLAGGKKRRRPILRMGESLIGYSKRRSEPRMNAGLTAEVQVVTKKGFQI
jgi:hypothetical protein